MSPPEPPICCSLSCTMLSSRSRKMYSSYCVLKKAAAVIESGAEGIHLKASEGTCGDRKESALRLCSPSQRCRRPVRVPQIGGVEAAGLHRALRPVVVHVLEVVEAAVVAPPLR